MRFCSRSVNFCEFCEFVNLCISKLHLRPQGYDAPVGRGGELLLKLGSCDLKQILRVAVADVRSGGERQRLALARAPWHHLFFLLRLLQAHLEKICR